MHDFDRALSPYTDTDGLVLERPRSPSSTGPETGNGIRNLCTSHLIRFLRRDLTATDVVDFTRIIKNCEVASYKGGEGYPPARVPGLYNRGPRKLGELIDPDDYRCLVATSFLVGAPFAKEVLWHGRTSGWSFNNLEPLKWTFHSWLGRQPDFVVLTKLCASQDVSCLELAALSASIVGNALSSDPGAVTLKWVQIEALRGRVCHSAIAFWDGQVKKRWGSVAVALGEYYGGTHPFALYCPS